MRRLVLVGGGHAHLEVLREAARRRFDGGEILVISPSSHSHYTGMIPGFVRGRYSADALTIDVAALARAAGATFREARARSVAADGRSVTLEDGETVGCELVSADVGSEPFGVDRVPGAAEHAHGARPLERAQALQAAVAGALRSGSDASVTVVGGGAGGVEVALAIRARAEQAGMRLPVTLIDGAGVLLAEFEPAVQRAVARVLAERHVGTCLGTTVERVEPDRVRLSAGGWMQSTVTVWLTGAAPVAMTAETALPKDDAGFWLVDRTLRSVSGTPVWGAGDCVSLRHAPWVPKAGVYAVREAPVLAANLRRAMSNGPDAARRVYRPQRSYLALLDTADGRALMRWKGRAWHGRAPLWLKRYIDQRFVRQFER